MNGETNKKMFAIVAALIVLTLAFRIIDIDKPYETWDEITTFSVGLYQWYNVAKLDFSPESWHTYDWSGSVHPPFGRFVYGIVNGAYMFSKLGTKLPSMNYTEATYAIYEYKSLVPGRILSAAFAMLTMLLVFAVSRRHFGLKVATISALVFTLLPAVIAQTKLAGLDAIMLFLYTLSIYLFLRGLESKRYFWASLVVTGLAISTKLNALSLFVLLPAIYFLHRESKVVNKKHLLAIPIVSAVIFYLVWPRLWLDPIGGIISNASWWQSLSDVSEYFLGGFSHPAYYMATYMLVTTPALILLFLFIGVGCSLKRRKFENWMILAWLVIPLFMYSFYSFRQAGPRYILMIYPALAILAALGIDRISSKLSGLFPEPRRMLAYAVVPAIITAYLVAIVVSVHPFYLDYYNELVGGPQNVYNNKMFAIGQWGEGIDAAAYWLNSNAQPNTSVQFFVMPRHVIPPIRDDITDLTPFIPKYISGTDNINWDMTNVSAEAGYVVENTFFRIYLNESFHELIAGDYKLVKTIDVQGAPLAWIYKRI